MAEEFGLQTYQLSDLVDEVLAFYESNPEPLAVEETNQVEEAIENDPTMSEDSEDENSHYSIQSAKEDFRICG